jgi:hypothetical protein
MRSTIASSSSRVRPTKGRLTRDFPAPLVWWYAAFSAAPFSRLRWMNVRRATYSAARPSVVGDSTAVPPVPPPVTLTGIVNVVGAVTVATRSPLIVGVLPLCPAMVTVSALMKVFEAVVITDGFATDELVIATDGPSAFIRRSVTSGWQLPPFSSCTIV